MVYSYSTTELSKPTVTYSLSETVANSAAWLGVSTIRLHLFAPEAWGVDDDGRTGAPTHLQFTPLKGHSTNTFSIDAIFSPLAIIWATTPYEEQAWG